MATDHPSHVMVPEDRAKIERLIEVGRELHLRGWVPATSGNLSVRLTDGTVAVTVSGCHKGRLTPFDFVRVRLDGTPTEGKPPSAETALHLMLYRRNPEIGAVLHPHTPASVVISRLTRDHIPLQDQELLKAFEGITTHQVCLRLPIFENDQDIPRLAGRIADRLRPETPAFLIRGHGLYTWGRSIDDALRHLEAVEFLLECELRTWSLKR